ncbi:MAG TPA: hypothetical protein VGN44_09450 [Candidatus Angelobacter sp.]|jgi:hypothetical protein
MPFDNDTVSNAPANSIPPDQQQPPAATPVTQQDAFAQTPQTQTQPNAASAQAQPQQKPKDQTQDSQLISNQPAQDDYAQHPAVKRANILYRAATALTGGQRFTTTIDDQGNRLRTPVPVSGKSLGLALAMEAIQGSLTGLAAGRGRGPGAAGAAAMSQQMAQQQEARDRQNQEATEDANNRASAITRKAQASEINSRILLTTAERRNRGERKRFRKLLTRTSN